MKKYTKYSKRIRVTFAGTAIGVMMVMAAAFPWFSNHSDNGQLYTVSLNGKQIGVCEDIDEIKELYIEARTELENASDENVYIDGELTFEEDNSLFGKADSDEIIKNSMYVELKNSTVDTKKQAYVLDIEGLTITLETKEDVIKLLKAAQAKYDEDNQFDVILYNDKDSRFEKITYDIIKADVLRQYPDDVMAAIDSENEQEQITEDQIFSEEDHIKNIEFVQDINITETYVPSSDIMKLDDAINIITKEKETNETYEVQTGDTLYGIAIQYELTLDELLTMNPDYTEEDYIRIGDLINVMVPKPELSVVVTEQKTYEEDYDLPEEYVYNDSMYNTYSYVINEGSKGHRVVVADVEYKDGVEQNVTILAEKVTVEPTARVVEVGTLTPPTYIVPVSTGRISSYYGWRWGRMHWGLDYACSTGTSVMASSGGVVVEAGWNGSFGYTVLISHPDGKQTRYAHLSRIYVTYGQSVKQGQVIAASGNTGNSTGPHLHFEIVVNGVRSNPADYLYK